jgi:cyclopropane-fatty-acyl-phospholipid synthase
VPLDGSGRVLEVGCGWGSFLLYSAHKYPRVTFVGFSNSATQQAFIHSEAQRRGLGNLAVLRLDINDFCVSGLPAGQYLPVVVEGGKAAAGKKAVGPELAQVAFDRVFSCECLEHSKDYAKAFKAIAKVLKDGGKAFTQILCHREYTYFMNNDDWMGRNFFTGGTIPSTKLFMFFSDHLVVSDSWYLR